MNKLPSIIPTKNLSFCWTYLDSKSQPTAIVARYDVPGKKKWFHQYHLNDDKKWEEGAPTPLPLFGLNSLPENDYEGSVFIFEGEKCVSAAHHLGYPALTSMMGSSQGDLADWSILAGYRHLKKFILIPDQDMPGKKYMKIVWEQLRKACPHTSIEVLELPPNKKGGDLVDWIKSHPHSPPAWEGFGPIDDPHDKDLRAAFEELVPKQSIPATEYFSDESAIPIHFDKDPEPIVEILDDVLPCPIQTLPCEVKAWIQCGANQMQVPVDFLAAPFLVFVGSVIGRKRALQLRPNTNWIEFSNLWGMLIGSPSVMKSPAMDVVYNPVKKLSDRALEKYELELKQYGSDMDLWKIQKKAYEEIRKSQLKESFKKGLKRPTTHLESTLEEEPQKPLRKRYKSDDPTVEKMGELLIENHQGMLLFRDELSGWLRSFEKQGRENDRQFYLESWSGKKDFDVDRIGRGSLHVPSLFLSIFGSIQPGPLSQYVRSTIKGGVGDDGFLQRFQVMVWPDVKPDWKLITDPISKELEEKIDQMFAVIDQLAFGDDEKPVIISFSKNAQSTFDNWQKQFEKRLRSGELPPFLEAHLAKFKKLVPALCLILEHLKSAVAGTYPSKVNNNTLKEALTWVEYFESHTCRVYGCVSSAIPKTATELLKHIRKGDLAEPFSVRDVYHGRHWSGMATSNEAEEVLEYLVEKGHLGPVMIKTNGRPSLKYWVHPKVFEG